MYVLHKATELTSGPHCLLVSPEAGVKIPKRTHPSVLHFQDLPHAYKGTGCWQCQVQRLIPRELSGTMGVCVKLVGE